MGKRHLALLGVTDIAKHQWLFNELIIALPGQCALLCIQANLQWTPNRVQKCVICSTVDKGERAFIMIFVPDGLEARLAAAFGALLLSRESISATLARFSIEAPIMLLDDPQHHGNQTLLDGYATVSSALQMIFQGRGTDVSLN